MERKDKIERIYEVIAEKNIIQEECCPNCESDVSFMDWHYWCDEECCDEWLEHFWEKEVEEWFKPVFIWDLLDHMRNKLNIDFNYWHGEIQYKNTQFRWEKLRLPIQEQPDDCIDYIYDLIKGDNITNKQ